jgi:NRAMP (natural resistance-associated macrophage protein)-like metal ion transporter
LAARISGSLRPARPVRALGAALIAGAADDDPSSLSTYAVAGAGFGYGLLWITVVSTPMMAVLLGMSARIGHVTGLGLAAALRRYLPRTFAVPLALLIIAANTFNIGADLGGMAAAAHALVPLPAVTFAAGFGLVAIAAHLLPSRRLFTRTLTFVSIALFAFFGVAFGLGAVVAHPDWPRLLHGAFIPAVRPDRAWCAAVLAVFGTTITPYLFLWQSSQTAGLPRARAIDAAGIAELHAETNAGMILANAVAFCIIALFATAVASTPHDLASAEDLAAALRPLAGPLGPALVAVAMIGSGLLAVPVLASTSAFVAVEMFGKATNATKRDTRAFSLVAGAGVVAGIALAASGSAAVAPLVWAAIVNGIVAVPLVAAVVAIASSARIMREWRSSRSATAWGWFTVATVGCAAIALVVLSATGEH